MLGAAAARHADSPAQLGTLYAEFWEENLKLNPLTATYAGDPRYNGELPNFLSEEYEELSRAFEQKYLDRARAIVGARSESLTGQDRLSYDIFTLNRESELEDVEFPSRLLPVNQFSNFANYLRAARLRHERAAVRHGQGLRRLAEDAPRACR